MSISTHFRNVLVSAVACCERNGHASLADEIILSLPPADAINPVEGPAVLRPTRALTRGEALTLCQVRRAIYVQVNGDDPTEYDDERHQASAMARLMRPHHRVSGLLEGVRWMTLAEAAREPTTV